MSYTVSALWNNSPLACIKMYLDTDRMQTTHEAAVQIKAKHLANPGKRNPTTLLVKPLEPL